MRVPITEWTRKSRQTSEKESETFCVRKIESDVKVQVAAKENSMKLSPAYTIFGGLLSFGGLRRKVGKLL